MKYGVKKKASVLAQASSPASLAPSSESQATSLASSATSSATLAPATAPRASPDTSSAASASLNQIQLAQIQLIIQASSKALISSMGNVVSSQVQEAFNAQAANKAFESAHAAAAQLALTAALASAPMVPAQFVQPAAVASAQPAQQARSSNGGGRDGVT